MLRILPQILGTTATIERFANALHLFSTTIHVIFFVTFAVDPLFLSFLYIYHYVYKTCTSRVMGEENVNPSGFVLPQLVHSNQFAVNTQRVKSSAHSSLVT